MIDEMMSNFPLFVYLLIGIGLTVLAVLMGFTFWYITSPFLTRVKIHPLIVGVLYGIG